VPKKRGGRKRLIDSEPQLQPNFQQVLQDQTAGDPVKPESLWPNLSVSAIADRMAELGTPVDRTIVEQLLDQAQLGRRQALKTMAMDQTRDRNQQFETISFYKQLYIDSPNPILSIDTKKRELLGNFQRDGHVFTTQTIRVFDHDYPSFADGHVIPHGLFDLKRNRGYINLGGSYDTSEFACDSIFQWWNAEGHAAWPHADSLLLLCDGGGSNSARQYLFKQDLQALANRIGLEIRVCHYPPYTSKYNPIEHRLFAHVTRACQGVIFKCVEQVRHYMAKTTTRTGLSVAVNILDNVYEKGRKVAEGFKNTMRIVFDNVLPRFNYRAIPIPMSQ
jgi:Rhodopirellula transposase DDE domain